VNIQSENEMMATAGDLGKVMLDQVDENYVIFLEGDLGAGKTTFVKGFMKGMNFEEVVNSPTFSLIERIELQKHYIFHVDLYRINNKSELFELDLHEESYLDKPSIHLIEWPQKGEDIILSPDLRIKFKTLENPNHREIFFEDLSNKLKNNLSSV
jgi:ATPase, YjeE family